MKAILIGNGVTAQIIDDYQDKKMINLIKAQDEALYNEIDGCLEMLRALPEKSKDLIVGILREQGLPDPEKHYQQYFVDYKLLEELHRPQITAIETLLKVAQLYHHINVKGKEYYNRVRTIANKIYYNDGNNGLESANGKIDISRFREFICGFDAVFTTNFDRLLDDVYDKEVFHLHGGFDYRRTHHSNGADFVTREKVVDINKACLIWGKDEQDKLHDMQGGFSFAPTISFPFVIGSSVLDNYLKNLKNSGFSKIYIWGYSGLNDGHINKAIDQNVNIQEIIYFCHPDKLDDLSEMDRVKNLFSPSMPDRIKLNSWNMIWDIVSS